MKSILFFLTIIFALNSTAQELSTFPELPFSDFGEFDVEGDKIIANGSCDLIWYSSDGGANWDYVSTPNTIYDVKLWPNDSENRAILVGRGVYIFDFEDGIINDFASDTTVSVFDTYRNVAANDDKVYVSNSEYILETSFDDLVWEEIYSDTFSNDYIYTMELFGEELFLGGREGKLVELNVNSYDWELKQEYGDWITDISMGSSNVGYISCRAFSHILKTEDGWDSSEELVNMPERIGPLAFGENVVLTVNTNRIYWSEDGGQSATYIKTNLGENFGLTHRALFSESGTLYLSGRGAMLAKTDDMADSWDHLNPINRSNLEAVHSDGEGNIVIVGGNETVYISNDDGDSWVDANWESFASDFQYLYSVLVLGDDKYMVSDDEKTMVIENGAVVESVDGASWGLLKLANDEGVIAIQSEDGEYVIKKSSDGGASWNFVFQLDNYATLISQSSEGKLFIANGTGAYTSVDNGDSWQFEDYNLSSNRSAVFYNNQIGLVTSGNMLFKTEDGGTTFEEIASGYAIDNIHFLTEDHFFYTTASNQWTTLRMTENGGETFATFFQNCATTYGSLVTASVKIVLAQRNGHIQVVPLENDMVNANTHLPNLSTIDLYPNPIKSGSILHCSESTESLTLISVVGEKSELSKLSDYQYLLPELANGIYFAQLQKEDHFQIIRIVVAN